MDYTQKPLNSNINNVNKTFERFANDYGKILYDHINNLGAYSPPSGSLFMKDVNYDIGTATQTEITEWLKNPLDNAVSLRALSQYLDSSIMQYKRTLNHFSQILTFKNQLVSVNSPDLSKSAQVKRWKSGYNRCLEWLKKFNLKYQKNIIMEKLVLEGGIFTYLSETDHFNTLIEIPTKWCYITGRTDIGWTYAINLSYFDKYVEMFKVMPELYKYYETFIKMREQQRNGKDININKFQYYPVPFDKGYVFCMDLLRCQVVPPFQGVFKDALSILDYKNLIKQKTTLDTWKMIAQIVPRNDDNEPALDANLVQTLIQLIQQSLPTGVKTFATPMDVQELNFNNAQNINNIVGTGERLFWGSAGVNATLMDGAEKTVESVRSSLKNDVGMVSYIYRQFENFINIQLYKQSREFQFRCKIFGDIYTDMENMKEYSQLVKGVNFPVTKLFAYADYEPYEIDAILNQEKIMKYKDRLEPIVSAFNTKGFTGKDDKSETNGRPENDQETNASEQTKTYQNNEEKKVT